MENSIEEDIKKLRESIIKEKYHIYNKDLKIILEHILSDYKRVLKENEELLEVKVSASAHNRILELEKENEELNKLHIQDNKHLDFIMQHSITVQKIKDKIEELNNISNAEKLEDIMIGGNYTITELVQYVLQELIE